MAIPLTQQVAELEARLRLCEDFINRIISSDGTTIKATALQQLLTHNHSGGGQGGPISGARVTTFLEFDEQSSAPGAAPTGRVRLYAKTDGRLYSKDDTNTESAAL